jgi:hypothetical protein
MRVLRFAPLVVGLACTVPRYEAVGGKCDDAHACPYGLACVDGVCQVCQHAAQCGASEVCSAGACTSCSDRVACPRGEQCVGGRCLPACDVSLQSLIDAADPNDIVVVPSCVYRETVSIDHPLALAGRAGAEVRGSDVWSGFQASNGLWTKGTLPPLGGAGCSAGQVCRGPEQVFLDGLALRQVSSAPKPGEFLVDANRSVVLADDPTGRVVEVTVRRRWLETRSDGLTIEGLVLRHAAAGEEGAITNDGYSGWTLRRCAVSDTASDAVVLSAGSALVVERSTISRPGRRGISAADGSAIRLSLNRVDEVNVEGFDDGDYAGIRLAAPGVRAEGNEISHAPGSGIDAEGKDVTLVANRIHHTRGNGISLQYCDGALIEGNAVWETGWGPPPRGWGFDAGLLLYAVRNVEVRQNRVAWNGDGITIISHDVGPQWSSMFNIFVHDNVIVGGNDPRDGFWDILLGWLSDDPTTDLYAATSNNRGARNLYWDTLPEGKGGRFNWGNNDGITMLSQFNLTPGEDGGRYLTFAEKDALLSDAGVPTAPEAH